MSNQDNQNKSSWEEVQGLSWIFYEDYLRYGFENPQFFLL